MFIERIKLVNIKIGSNWISELIFIEEASFSADR